MQNKYDCAIIGDGPAGLSAAVNLLQRGIQPVVFGVGGSLLQKAERVDNYLGLPAMDGQAMYAAFLRHAADSGAELRRVKVNNIMPLGGNFIINAGGDLPEARTVILATGAAKARAVPGEAELLGMGVSYCATCDGMLYRGKKTVVWALCAEAWQEAEFLQSIGCEVTVIAPAPPKQNMPRCRLYRARYSALTGKPRCRA